MDRRDESESDWCEENIYSGYENYCRFYLALTERLSERGYTYPDYKISLHECRGNEDYKMSKEDFDSFDFRQTERSMKPFGLWFSDFYTKNDDIYTWIGWCINEMPEWVDPRKCKYILVGKFREDITLTITPENVVTEINPYSSNYMGFMELIDWSPIKEKYPGGVIVTSPYSISSNKAFSGWDVASYVAWNREGLEDLQVFEMSEFQDLIDLYIEGAGGGRE